VKETLKQRLIPRKLTIEPEEELRINEEEKDFSFYAFAQMRWLEADELQIYKNTHDLGNRY
jgi:hypothetical protein